MSILEKTRNIGTELEGSLEKGYQKGKELLRNVASHLPFTNFAKDRTGDIHLEVDLPGVKKDDVEIKIEGDTLIVSAERRMKKEVNEDDYYIMESSFGRIERFFTLPESIDKNKINAKYTDGRLLIDLVKKEEMKPKKIEINHS